MDPLQGPRELLIGPTRDGVITALIWKGQRSRMQRAHPLLDVALQFQLI